MNMYLRPQRYSCNFNRNPNKFLQIEIAIHSEATNWLGDRTASTSGLGFQNSSRADLLRYYCGAKIYYI
jgi:hypothetical protein